jgi:hypothetical protein
MYFVSRCPCGWECGSVCVQVLTAEALKIRALLNLTMQSLIYKIKRWHQQPATHTSPIFTQTHNKKKDWDVMETHQMKVKARRQMKGKERTHELPDERNDANTVTGRLGG